MSEGINLVIAKALALNDHPNSAWDDLSPNQRNLYEAEAFSVEDALDTAGLIPDLESIQAEAMERAARSVAARAASVSTWLMHEAAAVRAGTQSESSKRNAAAVSIVTSVLESDWRVYARYPSSTALEIVGALGELIVAERGGDEPEGTN